MASTDDIRYRDVPESIPHELVDACWEFGDEIDSMIEVAEEAGKLVFNAPLHAEPGEWIRRLGEARERLDVLQAGLAKCRIDLGTIEGLAPKVPI